MKKFFATLILSVVVLTAGVVHAARPQPLAEIDTYNFYQNMGYEVDCSHFERVDGKQLFSTILIEEPLAVSKDLPNMLVYADQRKGFILEIDMYLRGDGDKNEMAAFVAKVINALDPAAFQANQTAIEQSIAQLMNSPSPREVRLAVSANRHYTLYKEEDQGNALGVYIEAAAESK